MAARELTKITLLNARDDKRYVEWMLGTGMVS